MKVTIIGGGAYALGLSFMFHENTNEITIYSKVKEEIEVLKKYRKNDQYLKDIIIYDDILLTTNLEEAITDSDLIVIAVATRYIESICQEIRKYYQKQHLLIASKGIDQNKLLFASNIVKSIINTDRIAVISGPTFAMDLANKQICGLALASHNQETTYVVKTTLENHYLKLRATTDMLGIELCGSIKNVLALAAGMLEGLKTSQSTKAMFLTESLHDVKYLIKKLGGDGNTILSFAGFGDILLTCTSTNSRNFSFGKKIGEKQSKEDLDQYLKTHTVEGVYTLKSLSNLLEQERIELPIISLIYEIVFRNANPEQLLEFLIQKK